MAHSGLTGDSGVPVGYLESAQTIGTTLMGAERNCRSGPKAGGPLYLKRILPGTKAGLYHLISINPTTPEMLDREIESIARIGWIRPADE